MGDLFAELASNFVECGRCNRLCSSGSPPNPKAQLMAYAPPDTPKEHGLCADCAATAFLKGFEFAQYAIDKNGIKILLDPRSQELFAAIMVAGNADAKPEEINWQNVADNWELPVPKKRRRK